MADENLYRVRAERGEVQIGTWVNMIRTPSFLMLLRAAGLDFARIDMEHSPFSMETVADMAALARAMDFPMVVRPPEGNREWIAHRVPEPADQRAHGGREHPRARDDHAGDQARLHAGRRDRRRARHRRLDDRADRPR